MMELKLVREKLAVEQLAASGRSEAEVEGSISLPGALRQEAKVLYAGAEAVVLRAEGQQDRGVVTGRVLFRALYTQGDEQVRSMEATADFTHQMELAGASARCELLAEASVRTVESSVYGGQLNLRAHVDVQAQAMLKGQAEAVTGLDGVPGLELQTRAMQVEQTAAAGRTEAMLREEFDLPASLGVVETLFATALAQVEEVSGGAGRASVSGRVLLTCYHAGRAPGLPLICTHHALAFDQCVDLNGRCGEELRADVQVLDVAAASQESGGERTLRTEVQLRIHAEAVDREELTVITDAYTTEGDDLALTAEGVSCRCGSHSVCTAESTKAVLLLPDRTPALKQVLAAFINPELTSLTSSGNRLTAEGMLHVTLLALAREDEALLSVAADTPFRQTFASPYAENDAVTLRADEADARILTADRAEVRCVLTLSVSGVEEERVNLVTDAAQVPPKERRNGVALVFAGAGDTLWSIARQYRVPSALVQRLNPELSDPVPAGQGVVVWRRCSDAADD